MPSPEGEVAGNTHVVVDASVLRDNENISGESDKKFPSENGTVRNVRLNAKRKPDKSKIFRIRANDTENQLRCPYCQYEALSKEDLEDHCASCGQDGANFMSPSETTPEYDQPEEFQNHQDVANNNKAHALKSPHNSANDSSNSSMERANGYDSDGGLPEAVTNGPLGQIRQLLQESSQLPIAQQLAQSNMALEAIQNARMALAQFASNAIGNGQPTSPQAMQEMAVLQSTLYTLQHQQMMQLQLIQQLQAQLSIKNKNADDSKSTAERKVEKSPPKERSKSPVSVPQSNDNLPSSSVTSSFINSLMERFTSPNPEGVTEKRSPSNVGSSSTSGDVRDRPLSPPLTASSIASSVIQHTDPPPSDEPNTLEMLQRTANQVLNNASQGLLTSRLIDDYSKPPDGKDSYYKHRCRYCGKVFGSDSALQIHVRSHTGERPFKCNICGNRFTTKGNLKVHFQRHSARFPHVKMNPHPVPEHLDKFHPPLLAQLGELKDFPTAPTGPPNPFSSSPVGPSLPPFRLSAPPPLPHMDLHKHFHPDDLLRRPPFRHNKDESENLSRRIDSRKSPDILDEDKREEFNMELDENVHSPNGLRNEQPSEDPTASMQNKDCNISDDEKSEDNSAKQTFRESLEEVLRDSKHNQITEKMRESLRNTINDFRNSLKEATKEKLEDSSLDLTKERNSPKDSVKDVFRESVGNSPRDLYSEQIYDKGSNADRESNSETGLDIRIREDQELKESNDSEQNDKEKEDMETDSIGPLSPGSDQPTDLRMRPIDFRPLNFPNLPFPGPRLPLNFPILPGLSPPFQASSAPPTPSSLASGMDPAADPNIYANLLPRPGSSDNSWEALIEIQKASETMKLEQFVNNIEHKLTDPNQCVICQRVLSCKSALQMHYRTHTGERPFKCKICGRAFTTKGNLKTHMGVHRAKPPMRMLHQCPVCHKKYTNALVLQQHIRLHTGEPTDLTPEQISAAEVRDYLPGLPGQPMPQLLPTGFPLPPQPLYGFPPVPLHLRYQLSEEMIRRHEEDSTDKRDDEDKYLRLFNNSSPSSSTGSVEQRTAEDLSLRLRNEENINGASPRQSVSPTPSDYSDVSERPQDNQIDHDRLLGGNGAGIHMGIPSSEGIPLTSSAPIDLVSRAPPLFSPFGLFPPPLTGSQISPAVTQSLSTMNSLYMPKISSGRGNTTCHLCFKTFACQSALEIHYRSHTKERPFKCNGNMKQHMLTHKIKDNQSESSKNSSLEETPSLALSTDDPDRKVGSSGADDSAPGTESHSSLHMPQLLEQEDEKSRIKRERDSEHPLPVPKRPTAPIDGLSPTNNQENKSPASEPPLPTLSPQGEISSRKSPLLSPSSAGAPNLPLANTAAALSLAASSHTFPSSLSLPSSLALPPSLSHSSPLSLGIPLPLPSSLYPASSMALGSAQPLPHS